MNRVSRFLCMLAVAIITTTATVHAQTDDPEPSPCTPTDAYNCPQMHWQGPYDIYLQVPVCGQVCTIHVFYWQRDGTCGSLPPLHEFQITQIELLDPTCPYN